jgi:molybdate transport system regulatory protein
MRLSSRTKVWLEYKGKPLLGAGRYRLLSSIQKTKSLKESASVVGISYKTAYNYIRRMERTLGKRVIVSRKGGPEAGGSSTLTEVGQLLIKRYREVAR